MKMLARAYPITSRDALIAFAKAIDEWSDDGKAPFFAPFGKTGRERWFYQEIAGKPHVISVVESASSLDRGFDAYGKANDPFTLWFREQARELTGVDLLATPKGPPAELVYELKAR